MKDRAEPGLKILVVDDESTVCKAIKLLLEFDGHEVQTVESGEAALVAFEKSRFDVVITDYSMWGMKGDQLAVLLKERRPGQPIIMATAFAADFHSSGKPAPGVDLVISKPFSLLELREAIANVTAPRNSDPDGGTV